MITNLVPQIWSIRVDPNVRSEMLFVVHYYLDHWIKMFTGSLFLHWLRTGLGRGRVFLHNVQVFSYRLGERVFIAPWPITQILCSYKIHSIENQSSSESSSITFTYTTCLTTPATSLSLWGSRMALFGTVKVSGVSLISGRFHIKFLKLESQPDLGWYGSSNYFFHSAPRLQVQQRVIFNTDMDRLNAGTQPWTVYT